MTFNKIKEIFIQNNIGDDKHKQHHELAKSISKSDILELSEDKTKVRLKLDIPTKTPEEIDENTIYVEQIPLNSTHDSLKSLFSKYGKVNYISLPRYKKSRQIKQFCFVEFDDVQSVQNVLTGFKKFDAVLQFTAVKPENLLSIATFESKTDENDEHEPPAKKIKLNNETDGEVKDEQQIDVNEAHDLKKEEEEDECDDHEIEENPNDGEEMDKAEETNAVDDVTTKKKKLRKHKRNQSKKKFIDERMMAMKVMKRSDWKKTRNAYLNLERQKAKEIKKILRDSYNKRNDHKNQQFPPASTSTKASPKISFYGSPNERSDEAHEQATESIFESYQSGNLNFTPGCIVNIKFREPCVDSKEFKNEIKQFPCVEYVDILEGGSQCYIRVSQGTASHELIRHYSSCEYETEILKDDLEKEYWKKIFDNREKKKRNKDNNKNAVVEKRHRKRGREKLVIKISKATQSNQIIRFGETEDHME